jgi:hypothetical protein
VTPDPKPPKRVRDLELLKELHARWRGDCVLADLGGCVTTRYSLHHIHPHPRDDVEANLAMLCGDGTTGHHGLIEHHDYPACRELAAYLIRHRLDTMEYLGIKLDGLVATRAWLADRLHYV